MKKLLLFILCCFAVVIHAQNIDFPDPALKTMLISADVDNEIANNFKIDSNGDGEIQVNEALEVQTLNIVNTQISNLAGLEAFENLLFLTIGGNISLQDADLGSLHNLVSFTCSGSGISALDFSQTKVKFITITGNPQLEVMILKNGVKSQNSFPVGVGSIVYFAENPNLHYICVDESEAALIQSVANNNSSNSELDVVINSYCSFVPGGSFYTVEGNSRYDADTVGCTEMNPAIPALRYGIIADADSGYVTSDDTGHYEIPLQAGNYSFTPVLENPSYFTVTPPSITLNFPSASSPYTQDFCVAPNGAHPNLELVILPIVPAVPGFVSSYKIVYRNTGTQIESGQVTFHYHSGFSTFVDASLPVDVFSQDLLTWNFSDLQPFESREIMVKLQHNTPTDPELPLNSGDLMYFTGNVTSSETDENPSDNTFTLYQTLVNSYDPNDKTCLQGDFLHPDFAGTYVHYIIRFENTGTANAQNIVVKDIIDTAKFDVASLVPLDGSHPFTTRITEGNKVEFIFENIQLPFDDASNDGFVAFKIKTKPTLVAGDAFSNSASIYFDYNAPIVTDPVVTTLGVLGNPDFGTGNSVFLYPNPVRDVLTVDADGLAISSLVIYDMAGREVMAVTGARTNVDVSGLNEGMYFLKVRTETGTSFARFLKK